MLYYSVKFKKEVRQTYPDDKLINNMLKNNDEELGKELRKRYLNPLNFEEVENAKDLNELKETALRKKLLYQKWCDRFMLQKFWTVNF